MKEVVKVVLGLAGALALASPAEAQEANSGKGGFWAGVVVGAEKADLGRKKEKPVYGAAAGYDFTVSGALLGAEIEASDSSSGGCSHQVDDDGDRLCYKAGRDLYAGLRAGAFVIPELLIYAKGGYVNGAYRVEDENGADGEKFRGSGWRVGAGVERDFGRGYIRVEYRYTDYFGSYSKHQGVAGVGLRF